MLRTERLFVDYNENCVRDIKQVNEIIDNHLKTELGVQYLESKFKYLFFSFNYICICIICVRI